MHSTNTLEHLLLPGAATQLRANQHGFATVLGDSGHAYDGASRFDGLYGRLYDAIIQHPGRRRLAARLLWGVGSALDDLESVVTRSVANARPGEVLLDVPCGGGTLLPQLAHLDYPGLIIAADRSAVMLVRAADVAASPAADRIRVHLLQCDALDLPLRDGCVDRVVSINGLHCMADHAGFLRELRRVLAPGGAAWITTLVSDGSRRNTVVANIARHAGIIPLAPPTRAALHSLTIEAGFCSLNDLGGRGLAAFRLAV